MNIYTFVQDVCEEATLEITTGGKQRLVGTLRSAGFKDALDDQEIPTAKQILLRQFEKLADPQDPQLRTAGVESPLSLTAKFEEIETLRSKNLCPRCKNRMEQVKLATYEPAKFCKQCKVALWMDR